MPSYEQDEALLGAAYVARMEEAHRKKVEMMKRYSMNKDLFREPFDMDVISTIKYFEAGKAKAKPQSDDEGYGKDPEVEVDMTLLKNNHHLSMIWRGNQKEKLRKIEYLDQFVSQT